MKSKESWERELVELIDDNLERFLKSTPYSSLGNSDYGKKLTPDMFYNTIYYGDNESIKCEKELNIWLNDKKNNTAVVTGYTGCGKTTFVNHFVRQYMNMNVVTIDFERKNVNVNNVDKRYESHNKEKSEEQQNSFNKNEKEKTVGENINVITYKLGLYIYQSIKSNLKISGFSYELCKLYEDNYDYFDENETLDNNFLEAVFNECKIYQDDSLEIKERRKKIKAAILNLDIENMFSLLLMVEMTKQLIEKKPDNVLFFFDNLDIAYEGQLLDDFYSGFLNFIMNWGEGLPKFVYNRDILGEKNIYTNFKFIFCMRETSKSKISEHFKKKTYTIVKAINISEVYDKANIANKRIELLEKYSKVVGDSLLSISKIIKELLEDKYNNKNIFPLFNHDYRSTIENMVEICTSNSALVKEYCFVNNVSYGDKIARCNKYGARGIIFRLLFDIFKENGYLDKISIFDFNEETHNHKLSVARLILTLLSNRMTVNGKEAYKIETAVGINEIYSAYKGIIDPKVITDCIYNMYSMRDSRWSHLVTYEKMCGNSENHIYKELSSYQNHEQRIEYSSLCLTCSGSVYLSIMATHFEFFASRLYGSNQAPLFSKKNLQKNNGHYRFENVIEGVLKAVKECCQRIKEFDTQFLLPKFPPENRYARFLGSEYVYKERRKKKITAMFHGERIIHAHISYLDAYRLYLINNSYLNADERADINKLLTGYIEQYIKIFIDKNLIYSDQTVRMMDKYVKCVENVKADYYNFSIFINVDMTSTNDSNEGENYGTSDL